MILGEVIQDHIHRKLDTNASFQLIYISTNGKLTNHVQAQFIAQFL